MQYLRMLMRYKAWANEVLFACVGGLREPDLVAPQPIVFGSLLRTLNHVQAMDRVWRAHLLGERHGYDSRNPEACPSFAELVPLQRELDRWYVAYAESLPAAAADETVGFEFIGGGAGRMSRQEILLHAANHGTYHRGHIADMLYRLGVPPPTTDLPVFLRSQAASS